MHINNHSNTNLIARRISPPTLKKIPFPHPSLSSRGDAMVSTTSLTSPPASSWRRRDAEIGPPSIQFGESMCSGRARDYWEGRPRARAYP
ncbi:hypothetical protein CDAR_193481 [Caerostris darwini]|uniref:Uncharacterized protein n=1 Tax=Caerostris darwini TaxID=1538125 RepID=A0AAV4RQZ7_9ARAC|nr:hypothetical protein CDAR_193481 [Caerostris darwini]